MYYETSVVIDATPDEVWAVMRDVERWPDWTPTVTNARADGELREGAVVRIQQPRLPVAEWTVNDLKPGQGFSWISKATGMTTVADHRIVPAAGGDAVTVTLSLRQSGPLAPIVGLFMARLVRRYVDTEAQGLRRRCERTTSQPVT
ncbi:SRPBCC family protein [Frankia sp. CNm7]|uniref:SRPBCC family protein n=1 Tax=Frankia nepalensis TaxID=1836974 RepID=A0A937UPB5_9ACTN|nr:SRPBCC family protein [Frankia nepalensis]MBL7498357.1 SRPBCC family protein [Frankia nepalensis]MBL7513234.1 SRPBCC family protein [Frankia nepalensis]MBL7524065.1 SRPBCC family protein [Frankia nepalensis]MBL7628918.1 SRPBCC family protein [Frankia nepalensis]